ncbi:response regulator [Marinobacterium weihaiense]|uniref:Response regulator transcription factor n=1 Tax=Marinobacterium weihaiense TaxID=2851016 RepID=A0ABS6M6A7_9GAMM|nr:response regulator transcription factor [Marinobacterium weihaiense]MBV0931803.1 response regulator transcription factor [Marinobacterium weihaiense]
MSKKIRILLVDDHSIVRAGFQHMLLKEADMEIVAEAENGSQAVELYREVKPDVVVMDLAMPADHDNTEASSTSGGLDAIKRIMLGDPDARILVLTIWEASPYPSRVAEAGVKGYVTKRCAQNELVHAVREVNAGREYFSSAISQQINQDAAGGADCSPIAQLTRRELEIFTLLAEGRSVNAIAESVFLSPKTVHAHRANILRKLKLSNGSEIIHLALRSGIIQA